MSAADELRTAARQLRCEHAFPCQPPHGTLWAPGPCTHCGTPRTHTAPDIPDWLRPPLAAWLESWTGLDIHEAASMPEELRHALNVARAVNGTARP